MKLTLNLTEPLHERFLRLQGEGGFESPESFLEAMLGLADTIYSAKKSRIKPNELIIRNSITNRQEIITRNLLDNRN